MSADGPSDLPMAAVHGLAALVMGYDQPASRAENAGHLAHCGRLPLEVREGGVAQDRGEMTLRKRQGVDVGQEEFQLVSQPPGHAFPAGQGQHLRRQVHTDHPAVGPHPICQQSEQDTGACPHVQDPVSRAQAGQVDDRPQPVLANHLVLVPVIGQAVKELPDGLLPGESRFHLPGTLGVTGRAKLPVCFWTRYTSVGTRTSWAPMPGNPVTTP